MPKINILSPFVADLIAAGEVVERPASAVKELMENSVDAGARNITVEIRGGGAEYIRVTDDGCGMSPEDAGIAFLRHATSKLRDERGLEAIGTLGFRGEALAAIGSVSHVELLTRERGAGSGTRLLLDGGDITDMHEAGCPEGTSITIRGLFYNTPARLKFLKSNRAEGTACVQAALRCALGRPEVSIRCIRDGAEEFFTPGDGRAESAVYSLLGRELASAMLPARSEEGPVEVLGFAGSPAAGRGSRSAQFFFCNGRYIKSQLLQAAVEQAYRGTLLTGRYPACVIYLKLSAAAVDVNVHPAKTEVKFSDERRVFDAVHYAVLGALEQPRQPGGGPEEEELAASPARKAETGGPARLNLGYSPYAVRPESPGTPGQGQRSFVTNYSFSPPKGRGGDMLHAPLAAYGGSEPSGGARPGTVPVSPAEPEAVSRYDGIEISDEDVYTLACLAYHEARGEPFEGQVAVIEVVLNRCLSDYFPDTVEEVVFQKYGDVWQFSPAPYLYTAEPTETQYEAVYAALAAEEPILPLDTVYFSTGPYNDSIVAVIGNHYFCSIF